MSEKLETQVGMGRNTLLVNVLFPLVIFGVSAYFSGHVLRTILPGDFEFGEPMVMVVLSIFGWNIGVFALTFYYMDWRRQMNLAPNRLSFRLLMAALAWLLLNMILLVPIVTGGDSLLRDPRPLNGDPSIIDYIALVVMLFLWGSLNFRLGSPLKSNLPLFIRFSVLSSQVIFTLLVIPLIGWAYVIYSCACH